MIFPSKKKERKKERKIKERHEKEKVPYQAKEQRNFSISSKTLVLM
jgi:hypothetical protein